LGKTKGKATWNTKRKVSWRAGKFYQMFRQCTNKC